MFRIAAEELVFFLLRHKWLNQEKREIYEYAMEGVLLNGGLLIITLIISAMVHRVDYYIAFILFFVPLRTHLGGFHLKKSELCMGFSLLFYVATMMMSDFIYDKYGQIELLIMGGLSIICIFSNYLPVKNNGREKYNKTVANVIIVMDCIIVGFLWRFHITYISSIILLVSSAMLFFLIAKIEYLAIAEESEEDDSDIL